MNELEYIRDRLRNVIVNTCNKIGCKNCDLKWADTCQALELQSKEMELMFNREKEIKN